jgi:ADP-ribose pyrophosphatase YjhB (NUDIX family)
MKWLRNFTGALGPRNYTQRMTHPRAETIYCRHCGATLSEKVIEGTLRPHCSQCGHVEFFDPKVAAVVVTSSQDKVLMVRRGVQPALGEWSFPSGYVDRAEAVEDAAVREVLEETGLNVKLTRLVGVYSRTGNPVILVVFDGVVTGGRERAGHDVQEVGRFHKDDLPGMPFPHDRQILADWRAGRGREL